MPHGSAVRPSATGYGCSAPENTDGGGMESEMRDWAGATVLLAVFLVIAASASAGNIISFVDNRTGNSVDWLAAADGMNLTVNRDANFDAHGAFGAHPVGPLQSGFYYDSLGMTLDVVPLGSMDVVYGTGWSQDNQGNPPTSGGEGKHPASNHIRDFMTANKLIITFAERVHGVGFTTVDFYNVPISSSGETTHPISLEAWSGPGGTGYLLGSYDAVAYNFQKDYMYFMGLMSDDAEIRSVVLDDPGSTLGDGMGIDDIVFAYKLNLIRVDIDIKPGDSPNTINLGSQGGVPVAILGSTEFQADSIDPSSVTLAGAGVQVRGKKDKLAATLTDVDGDGLDDLLVHVDTESLELTDGDAEAILDALTFDGVPITGVDTIQIVGAGLPEPASLSMLALGALAVLLRRRRR